jgi:hypothetical protein
MGDRNEKPTSPTSHTLVEWKRFFAGGGYKSSPFIPAYVYSHQGQKRRMPLRPLSLWPRLMAWVRYYSIQWRWDVERKIARLLHRRWTG